MKLIKKITVLAITAACVNAGYSLVYVDGNAGYSYTHKNTINGFDSGNRNGLGFNVNAGVSLIPFTAIELGYTHFASPDYNNSSTSLNSYHLAAVLNIPMLWDFSAVGKLGLGYSDMGSSSVTDSQRRLGAFWGLGVKYKINDWFYTQALYQQYQNNGNIPDASLLSVGLGVDF